MDFYMCFFITTFFLSEENSFMATFFFLKSILPYLLTYVYGLVIMFVMSNDG